MASKSVERWLKRRSLELDELDRAHEAIGGKDRGRRYATQQVNQAYAVLLSSQFQGFCRDLHSESVDLLVSSVQPTALQPILRAELLLGRKLDRGNPNPGNIGGDFNRLGLAFWPAVLNLDLRNADRKNKLDELNGWRNAIAHQDFDPQILGGRTSLRLAEVRAWRKACDCLAQSFDTVLANHLQALVGIKPWC